MDRASNLDAADLNDLNRDFYADSPATYLRQRLMLLIAFGDSRAPLDAVFAEGVSLGKVSVTRSESARPEPEHDPSGFAAIESVALAYAVSETLLRHLAAHEHLPACPWIELSSFLEPGAVRTYSAGISASTDTELISRFRPLLRGSDERPDDVSEERWELDGEAIASVARAVADCYLTYVDANNALKHGGAVLARNPVLTVGNPESPSGVILDMKGPALKYLSRKRLQKTQHEWHEVTRFVNVESLVAQAALYLTQLEALWAVALARYLGDKTGRVRLLTPSEIADMRMMPSGSGLSGLMSIAMTRRWSQATTK